ncbi:hypothetical protein P171DRAFT_486209 [Karstenula rhodostoma CBS 690.94]|uniref:Uncharacterized protein n=1 Tax=Karstenula rhodostoma CBS 690.94 TaxID=1392251 RepID=A0A9P4PHX0_9PLEO|nr:hypothetical protein P171DRAFT_486209 [Karstenula rhodostoma CBS 690.94]
MEASRQFRKRPQSEVKPASHRVQTYEHRRTRSTETAAAVKPAIQPHRKVPTRESTAFAESKFLENDESRLGTAESPTNDIPLPTFTSERSPASLDAVSERGFGPSVGHITHIVRGTTPLDTPPPPSFPEYINTSGLSLDELTHTSGSPILKREFILNNEDPSAFTLSHELEDCCGITAKHPARTREPAGISSNVRSNATKDELSTIRDSVLAVLEEPTVSVAKQFAGPGHIEEQHPKPKVVVIGKDKNTPGLQTRRHSANQHPGQTQQAYKDAHSFHIKRKSLPITAEVVPESPTSTLESTREWLNSLANKESQTWSNESVVDTSERSEDTFSGTENYISRPQSLSAKSDESPNRRLRSLASEPKPSRDNRWIAKESANPKQSRNVRSATPGPTARPASPPLHRNTAENYKPLEKQGRDSWTLYSTSCWTEKAHLKTLLRGPVFEFRVEPHGKPFLVDVSQAMLKHFCGEKHVDRLIRDYSLRPEQRREEDREDTILVFPEELVDATAIMRIVRYMRRCCMRTTTLTKPHFQLDAPPSLEANIETIRTCNIFGLYADARRLQYFLTDKKIPGGKLTMEDVETIWEGYDGGLRDSAYTDALLTHLVYNVLGSDSVDREDIMVLLEQEEFAGLRELVSMELGIKKRAAESRDMFQMRKELERENRVNRNNGKGKRLSELEKIRASRGPMVQGRLLRVLSYDALLEPDLTAETRYKPRPGLGTRSVSTPDLTDRRVGGQGLESPGSMYQDALKEIKGTGAAAQRIERMLEGLSDVEEEISILSTQAHGRPAVPTLSGRKHEADSPDEKRVQNGEDVRQMVPRAEYQPSTTGMRGARNSIADKSSGTEPFESQGTDVRSRAAAASVPGTRPNVNVLPLHSQRTRVYATSNASRGHANNVGRRQPGSHVADVDHTHPKAGGASALRSRTDPWWGTLGRSPSSAKKKSSNKLKQIWDEVRKLL